jgi:GntR family transcriptional regulator
MASESQLLNRPLYLQVRDVMIERIGKGEWKPGAALPNETDLAREFGLSTGTLRKALDLLEAERVLTRRQGRGTFLNDQSSDAVVSRYWRIGGSDGKSVAGDTNTTDIVEAPANKEECRRLRLGPHDHVYRARSVYLRGNLPFMVEEASLPATFFPGRLEKKGIPHRIAALAQQHGILLGKAEERISVRSAPASIAATLHIAPDTPVMLLDRLLLTVDGQPIEWRVAHCHLAGGFYLAELD